MAHRVEYENAIDMLDGKWCIPSRRTAENGTVRRVLIVLPTDTMEWRAAEYGIDPADTATLLDVVLAEQEMTPQDWAEGAQLHDAPDIDTARADHLARCARVKLRHRISSRAANSPLARVVRESPMHPEALEIKAELVRRARAETAARKPAPAQDTEAERVQSLRALLHPTAPVTAGLRPAKGGDRHGDHDNPAGTA